MDSDDAKPSNLSKKNSRKRKIDYKQSVITRVKNGSLGPNDILSKNMTVGQFLLNDLQVQCRKKPIYIKKKNYVKNNAEKYFVN